MWRIIARGSGSDGEWNVEDKVTARGNTVIINRSWKYYGGRVASVRLGMDIFVPIKEFDFWTIPYISRNGNTGSRTVPTGMTLNGEPWSFREERTTAPGLMTVERDGQVAGIYTEPGRSEQTLCACSIVPERGGHTLRIFFPYLEAPKTFLGAAFPGRAEIQEQGLYTCASSGPRLVIENGACVQRKFYIVVDDVPQKRHGYAAVWESAWRNLREPEAPPVRVRHTENLLWRVTDRFYVENGKGTGFLGRIDPRGHPYGVFSIGWCVPTAMLVWLGLRRAIKHKSPELAEKVIRAMNFFVKNAGLKNGIFRTHYDYEAGKWSDRWLNAVQMGGGAFWLLRCVELLRSVDRTFFKNKIDVNAWMQFALKFCDHAVRTQRASGEYCAHWNLEGKPVGFERAMGIHSALAVLQAYKITGRKKYLTSVIRAACFYKRTIVDKEEGYGDCTDILNTTTENDGAFMTDFYVELHRVTGGRQWLDTAIRVAEYCLSYMYTYNVWFPPDTECARRRMRTRGFSAISPETAFVCFWFTAQANPFLDLWRETGETRWRKYAVALIKASLQMMSEQGDTFGLAKDMIGFRAEVIPVLDTIKDRRIWKKGMTGYTWDHPVLWPAVFNLLNFAVIEDKFPEVLADLEKVKR
jgi:hypothetical protein